MTSTHRERDFVRRTKENYLYFTLTYATFNI